MSAIFIYLCTTKDRKQHAHAGHLWLRDNLGKTSNLKVDKHQKMWAHAKVIHTFISFGTRPMLIVEDSGF